MNATVSKTLSTTLMATLLALAACGMPVEDSAPEFDNNDDVIEVNSQNVSWFSSCGGFDETEQQSIGYSMDRSSYCDAERLLWQYNANERSLTVVMQRFELNCSGVRDVQLERADKTIKVTFTDDPGGSYCGQRASCNCVYDVAAKINDVDAAAFNLEWDWNIINDVDTCPYALSPSHSDVSVVIDPTDSVGEHIFDSTASSVCGR